jgi:hypothetical protein
MMVAEEIMASNSKFGKRRKHTGHSHLRNSYPARYIINRFIKVLWCARTSRARLQAGLDSSPRGCQVGQRGSEHRDSGEEQRSPATSTAPSSVVGAWHRPAPPPCVHSNWEDSTTKCSISEPLPGVGIYMVKTG